MTEAYDFAVAEEPKPIAEVSEILQQEPLPQRDDSAVCVGDDSAASEELKKPLGEVAEELKPSEGPLPEAGAESASALKAIEEVDESLNQKTLPEAAADDSAAAKELKQVSVTLQEEVPPPEAADDSAGDEEEEELEFMTPVETLEDQSVPEAADEEPEPAIEVPEADDSGAATAGESK